MASQAARFFFGLSAWLRNKVCDEVAEAILEMARPSPVGRVSCVLVSGPRALPSGALENPLPQVGQVPGGRSP